MIEQQLSDNTVNTHRKRKLLIAVDWFDPAVRAGGPVQSCVNLVELMHNDANVAIVAGDRDLGDDTGFSSIHADRWRCWRNKARILYATPGYRQAGAFRHAVNRIEPDTIYLNGIFSSAFVVRPLLSPRGWRNGRRIVLAPRGMLKPSALKIKSWKKQLLLTVLQSTGSMRNVVFHATSEDEVNEIRSVFGNDVEIFCIPNVPCLPVKSLVEHAKRTGECRLCFVGRIHPIKNLLTIIQQLHFVSGHCQLDVIGPVEDQAYYQQCKSSVSTLPSNVVVNFFGPLEHEQARILCSQCDATVAPTHGENFGHAIFESFAMGVPAIISDRTMWRGLEKLQAGWDISLDQPERFAEMIDRLCSMNAAQHHQWRLGALKFANSFMKTHDLPTDYHRMFFDAPMSAHAIEMPQTIDSAAA